MVVSLSIAFFAGFISFISPCVLPLIPGYVSFICGTTLNELDNKSKNFILKKSIFFSLGFSLVFISLGATATFIGSFLLQNSKILSIGSGIIIIFFGIYLLEIIKINFLNKNFGNFNIKYSNTLLFPFIVGIAPLIVCKIIVSNGSSLISGCNNSDNEKIWGISSNINSI